MREGSLSWFQGYISGVSHSCKKAVFTFFINDRLVECGPLRRCLESVYTSVLPKATKPFVYLVRTSTAW